MQEIKGGDKMNVDKLKVKLFEKGKTYADVAKVLDISITAVANKMNKKSKFDCAEATIISDWLKLSFQDRGDIFLT